MNEPFQPGRDFAVALDRGDPLGRFRDEFHIPRSENGEEEIYFAGNSLGLLPKRTAKYVDEELEKLFKDYDRSLLISDPRRKLPKKPLGRGARKKRQKSYR